MARIHELLISSRDAEALAGVVGHRHGRDGPESEATNALADVLIGAPLVPHERLPADRVAMNSRVTYSDETAGVGATVKLVYPQGTAGRGHLPVTSPLGTALLGLREGQEIDCHFPLGGRRRCAWRRFFSSRSAAGRTWMRSSTKH